MARAGSVWGMANRRHHPPRVVTAARTAPIESLRAGLMVRSPSFVPGRQARERLRPAGPPHACQRRDRDHRHDRSRMGPGIPGQAGCRTQPDYDHDDVLPRPGPARQTGCPGRWPRGHGDHCTAGRPRHFGGEQLFPSPRLPGDQCGAVRRRPAMQAGLRGIGVARRGTSSESVAAQRGSSPSPGEARQPAGCSMKPVTGR